MLSKKKSNRSPGSDGLITEFYNSFWNYVKRFLIDLLNSSYNEQTLCEIQSRSLITLLPKGDKDTSFLTRCQMALMDGFFCENCDLEGSVSTGT